MLVNNAAVCFNDATLYGKVPHTPFEKQARLTVSTPNPTPQPPNPKPHTISPNP